MIPSLAFHQRRLVERRVQEVGIEAGWEAGSEAGREAGSEAGREAGSEAGIAAVSQL